MGGLCLRVQGAGCPFPNDIKAWVFRVLGCPAGFRAQGAHVLGFADQAAAAAVAAGEKGAGATRRLGG